MKSAHVRRLDSRAARTAARFIDYAARESVTVADLPGVRLPWFAIRAAGPAGDADGPGGTRDGTGDGADAATVLLFDEIGGSFGVSAAEFIDGIQAITAPVIHLRINSPGGSVFDAIAMYNGLHHHPARVVTYVDALAASAASIVAMAGDEIVMMPGSQMMIHDASAVEDGNAADMAAMSTWLDRQSDNVADVYRLRAGGDVAQWRDLMLAETWMFAQEAVDLGLADRVAEPRPTPDPVADELMTRSFDLGQYRYAGRSAAPMPGRRRPATGPGAAAQERRSEDRTAAVTTTTLRSPTDQIRSAAADRAAAYADQPAGQARRAATIGSARAVAFPASQMRAQVISRGGREFYRVDGTAVVFERRYEMWDQFGPYWEVVVSGAADKTLAADPDVAFLVNHRGITMARTTNGTLFLSSSLAALGVEAYLNPARQDVRDLVSAIDDKLITEMSFAFMVPDGGAEWSADFTEFRIHEVDINRGDVSGVNYGANPYTSIATRAREVLSDIDHLPAGAAREAYRRLTERLVPAGSASQRAAAEPAAEPAAAAAMAPVTAPTGGSVDLYEAMLKLDL